MRIEQRLKVAYRRLQVASAWTLWILLLLCVIPVAPRVALHLSDRWNEPQGDVLVVLGADMLGDGTIGVGSYWRSIYAARVWQAGKFRWLIVCGGKPPDHPRSLAAAMASLLVLEGVPREAILLEEQSGSTRENALRAKALIPQDAGQVALVTSDFHMWRARRVFERIGVPVVTIPYPDIGKRWNFWPSRLECYATLVAELIKIAYYKAHGWV